MGDIKDSLFHGNTLDFETEEEYYDTVLYPDITFSGNIRFMKPFMIKGKVSGRIEASSDLLVDTEAEVEADITTERVLIRGKVRGNITGRKLVYVTSSGSVFGDISSEQVVIEQGAVFQGKCSMGTI